MKTTRAAVLTLSFGLSSALALSGGDAQACGGCFIPPTETESTVVDAHRMALSISTTQTVLWDQIEYQGDPEDFAWVLPIKQGAVLELADAAWLDVLDAATTTTVRSPQLTCGGNGRSRSSGCSGFGCGASSAASLAAENGGGQGPDGPVTVVSQSTVGPYDTVTLSTDTPGALNDWLSQNGYAVDPSIEPVIDAYVEEGFDFLALRLSPGQGVRSMKPVRVVTPGASPVLPLRMVAAGTGAVTEITLFVIAEGRWQAQSFPNATIGAEALTWDFATSSSDYATVRADALAGDGVTPAWLTSFAYPDGLLEPVVSPSLGAAQSISAGSFAPASTIAEAYFRAMGGSCSVPLAYEVPWGYQVQSGCVEGEAFAATCAPPEGAIDAASYMCGEATDLARALIGTRPGDVWLTRLEASLPRAALAGDLALEAEPTQSTVDHVKLLEKGLNPPANCTVVALVPPAKLGPLDKVRRRVGKALDEHETGLGVGGLGLFLVALVLRRARSQAAPTSARRAGLSQ